MLLFHILEYYNSSDLELILRAIKLLVKGDGPAFIEVPNSEN